jgi:hypothetical protein
LWKHGPDDRRNHEAGYRPPVSHFHAIPFIGTHPALSEKGARTRRRGTPSPVAMDLASTGAPQDMPNQATIRMQESDLARGVPITAGGSSSWS